MSPRGAFPGGDPETVPKGKANPRSANGAARRKVRAYWRSLGLPCALCGKAIDYSLGMVTDPVTGKRRPHPMSFVVDEIIPVSKGGNPFSIEGTQPAHWICNARKGDRIVPRGRPSPDALPQPFGW